MRSQDIALERRNDVCDSYTYPAQYVIVVWEMSLAIFATVYSVWIQVDVVRKPHDWASETTLPVEIGNESFEALWESFALKHSATNFEMIEHFFLQLWHTQGVGQLTSSLAK